MSSPVIDNLFFEKLSVENLSVLIYLIPASAWDLKKKIVPLWYLAAGGAAAFVYAAAGIIKGSFSAASVFVSVMPGVLLLMLSWGTGGKVGPADGAVLICAGLALGLQQVVFLLMLSLFLSCLFSILLLAAGKASLRTRIPFLPFLAAGSLILQMLFEVLE